MIYKKGNSQTKEVVKFWYSTFIIKIEKQISDSFVVLIV